MEAQSSAHFPLSSHLKDLLEKSKISLILNTYDDIFSDFDPRPYSQRALSDDFLLEAKKASREIRPGVIELRFLVPTHMKNVHEEETIKERLHQHFRKHALILEDEVQKDIRQGILLSILGFVSMVIAIVVSSYIQNELIANFLRILFEPSGWFILWYGLDQIFYKPKEKKFERDFYKKMTHLEIHFDPY